MRIAVDVRPALRRGTGVGTYVESCCLALDLLPGDHSQALFSSSWKDRLADEPWRNMKRASVHDLRLPVRVLNSLWHRWLWPPVDMFTGPVDVSFSPAPLVLPARGKKIISFHDFYFLRRPEHTTAEIRSHYVPLVRKHARKADGIIAISEATRQDAAELLEIDPDSIVVGHLDCPSMFDQQPESRELEASRKQIPSPFFLFVGVIEPRKNLVPLLQAFDMVAEEDPEVRLVLAAERGWHTGVFDAALQAMRHAERVIITGYQNRVQLRALYNRALATVMISHCEGFGLPLVEAMACGSPLLVRDISAMPEVVGDAGLYWDGEGLEELAEKMQLITRDTELREKLAEQSQRRRAAFSWESFARKLLSLCEAVL